MAEYGLNKNSEGYADPTAAEAIKSRAKPGEIYKYKGREVLIVKNQGGYSNILSLSDHTRNGKNEKEAIEVAGRYTEAGMLSYAFNYNLGAFVERVTDEDFRDILKEVETALFGIRFDKNSKNYDEDTNRATAAINLDLEHENEALKKKYSLLRSMYDTLLDMYIDRFGSCGEHG